MIEECLEEICNVFKDVGSKQFYEKQKARLSISNEIDFEHFSNDKS